MVSKIAEKTPSWLTRILMPEIAEIKGELKSINARIDSSNTRIDSTNTRIDEMDKRLTSSIDELDRRLTTRIDSLRNELKADIGKVDSRVIELDKRLDMAQRLAVVEAKLREREKS